MKAAAYCRVSTEEQAIHGFSLKAQQDDCVKYLIERGYDDYEVFVDDGYSAKDMNRPALQRMLTEVKEKKIGMVVFWNVDRLTRDTVDGLIMCRDMFFKKGILFASLTEKIDISTADGEMMFTIRLSMAQAERRRIGERTRIGYAKRAQLGFRNSPSRPYGYDVGPNLVLTVNEDQKQIVMQIFEMYIGGFGTTKIARELNVMGIEGPRGGKWNHVAITHILQNLTYLGFNHWKPKDAPESERIIIKADHPPILEQETFDQTQEIMRRRSTKEMSRSSKDFYFSRILKCAICGEPYYGNISMQHGHARKSYFCSGKRKYGNCAGPAISEMKATSLILSFIRKTVDNSMNVNVEVSSADKSDIEKQRKQIERQLTTAKSEMERLVSLFMGDKIDLDIYEKKREETKNKITDLEIRMKSLPTVESKKITQELGLKLLAKLNEDWEYLTEAERKMIMQRMYKTIKIGKINGSWEVVEMLSALL